MRARLEALEQQQWSQQYDTMHSGVSDRDPVEESCVLRAVIHCLVIYRFLFLWLTDDAIRIYSI